MLRLADRFLKSVSPSNRQRERIAGVEIAISREQDGCTRYILEIIKYTIFWCCESSRRRPPATAAAAVSLSLGAVKKQAALRSGFSLPQSADLPAHSKRNSFVNTHLADMEKTDSMATVTIKEFPDNVSYTTEAPPVSIANLFILLLFNDNFVKFNCLNIDIFF